MNFKSSRAMMMLAVCGAIALSGCVRQPGPDDTAPRLSNAPAPTEQTSTDANSQATASGATDAGTARSVESNAGSGPADTKLAAFPIGTTANLPVGFPLPKYPGSRVITAQEVPKQQQLAMLLTQDQPPRVAQFYRNALAQQGWGIQNTPSNIRAVPGTEVLTALKPGMQAVVSITRNETLTRIDIVITTLKH